MDSIDPDREVYVPTRAHMEKFRKNIPTDIHSEILIKEALESIYLEMDFQFRKACKDKGFPLDKELYRTAYDGDEYHIFHIPTGVRVITIKYGIELYPKSGEAVRSVINFY